MPQFRTNAHYRCHFGGRALRELTIRNTISPRQPIPVQFRTDNTRSRIYLAHFLHPMPAFCASQELNGWIV
ncbi:UNVERIFIED_ORG: hypothetical protein BDU10_0644 [Burkholderia sp. CF145]|jgi:hypothetical protein